MSRMVKACCGQSCVSQWSEAALSWEVSSSWSGAAILTSVLLLLCLDDVSVCIVCTHMHVYVLISVCVCTYIRMHRGPLVTKWSAMDIRTDVRGHCIVFCLVTDASVFVKFKTQACLPSFLKVCTLNEVNEALSARHDARLLAPALSALELLIMMTQAPLEASSDVQDIDLSFCR